MTGATRIAPTPSGFLHVGNLVNFQLTAMVSAELGLDLHLRIDDVDQDRSRPQYRADIFRWLEFLEIVPAAGLSPDSYPPQLAERNRYWEALLAIASTNLDLFVCRCSRNQRVEGRCVAGCSLKLTDFDPAQGQSVRIRLASQEQSLWDRLDRPTYHLVNVVEDQRLGITHVVRGLDLLPSSQLHSQLGRYLAGFGRIQYGHHELIMGTDGFKLSKSQGSTPAEATADVREAVRQSAGRLLPAVLGQFSD